MTPSSSSSSSSSKDTTFHPFPYLPWELRARIWELAVSPRIVEIYVGQVRQLSKRDIAKYWALPLSSKLLFSSTPVPAALHACREARNHLTHPLTACGANGNGYYEKMSYSAMMDVQQQWSWQEAVPGPYIWVNFEVDMIDIGLQRFRLPLRYAGKIKRVKYKSPSAHSAFEVLKPLGKYCFPGVKEAEIECFYEVVWLATVVAWQSMRCLNCEVKDVVCIDALGKRTTLAEIMKEWLENRRPPKRAWYPPAGF